MDTIAPYLLKSIISSAVLSAWYWLWLRNKKFHNYNRFFLLSAIIISLVLPLFNFSCFRITQSENNVVNEFFTAISVHKISEHVFRFAWGSMLLTGIFTISFFLLLRLFVRILRLYHIKKSHCNTRMEGFYLIETQLQQAPFSFLNNLFWRSDISLSGESGKKIYIHELAHIHGKHTYDKLFSQMVCCIFWMNPFYRLIQKELNMTHEFIADARSIGKGDTESFALMLLQSHNEGKYLEPAHAFFHSPVIRRLAMIANTGKTKYARLRKISVVPVIMLIAMMFSFTVSKTQVDFQSASDLNDLQQKKMRDEKIAAEKADILNSDRQNQVSNNNISQAALLSVPFLTLKLK